MISLNSLPAINSCLIDCDYFMVVVLLQSPSVLPSRKEEKPHLIGQFQMTCWPQDSLAPTSKQALISLIELVERWQQKTGDGPVLVHCRCVFYSSVSLPSYLVLYFVMSVPITPLLSPFSPLYPFFPSLYTLSLSNSLPYLRPAMPPSLPP